MKNSLSLRRARTIVAYWKDGQFVIENYRTGVRVNADPFTVRVLDFFEDWHSIKAFRLWLPRYTPESLSSALRDLRRYTLLVQKGSEEAQRDTLVERVWSSWLPHAGFFHFGTQNVPYETRADKIKQILQQFLADSRQPSFFKHYYNRPIFALPPVDPPKTEFLRTLLRRRTHRQFSTGSLPLQSLSQLLFYTWGVTARLDAPLLGQLPLKTSPSSGARHPIEVYVLALHVQKLPPGLYHYAPERHILQQLHSKASDAKAVDYCGGQTWVRNAAALFIMTAVFPRAMWKYRTSRAYRTVLLDAGHICQTFCLLATSLHLAPFCTLALKDSVIEKELDLEGIAESVIYLAGVGLPREGARTSSIVRSRAFASL